MAKKNKQYGSEVEAAMKRFAKEDKNAYLIDMSDAELMGDRLHFNQNSAEYLGKQMYEQIKAVRWKGYICTFIGDRVQIPNVFFSD